MICMQAYPEWIIELEAEAYGVSTEVMEEILYAESGQTEACLMLDVYVPANVFDGNTSSKGQFRSPPLPAPAPLSPRAALSTGLVIDTD